VILGFDQPQADRIAALLATSQGINSISDVELTEWDVLVTRRGCVNADGFGDLHVIAFESNDQFGREFGRIQWQGTAPMQYSDVSRATEFEVAPGLAAEVDSLVTERLGPRASSEGNHRVVCFGGNACKGSEPVRPFLVTRDGRIIAGTFRRSDRAECWCLPSYATEDAERWVSAALAVWGRQDVVRFPPREADWQHKPEWRTPAERLLADAVNKVIDERNRVVAELNGREAARRADLAREVAATDAGRRLLLTAQREDLCEQAAATLEELGFEVERMDAVWELGAKREDLRVRNREQSGWIALAEVRGYSKGAKIADLARLNGRFRTLYQLEVGKLPSATWLIVNHFIEQDPAARELVLQSNEDELDAFAQDGVLVIDSVRLFECWRAVEDHLITAEQARTALVTATGRFALPATASV
jgi:hypothetical protein